jgi:hypothetical protein
MRPPIMQSGFISRLFWLLFITTRAPVCFSCYFFVFSLHLFFRFLLVNFLILFLHLYFFVRGIRFLIFFLFSSCKLSYTFFTLIFFLSWDSVSFFLLVNFLILFLHLFFLSWDSVSYFLLIFFL